MVNHLAELRRGFIKVFLLTVLAFFLIPAGTLIFTHHAGNVLDQDFNTALVRRVPADQLSDAWAFYEKYPPSQACAVTDPSLAEHRAAFCEPLSALWQFYMMNRLSVAVLTVGVLVLLAILALGVLAFRGRGAQAFSLRIGRRLLMGVGALEVVVQGVMTVWLSYWLTAYFFGRFFPQLIGIIGFLVAIGVFYAVVGIFRRLPQGSEQEGEVLTEEDAPALWQRIKKIAERLRTTPPDNIVAGIDANFFVTETPLHVAGQKLQGRTLYISIPLLRQMETTEADCVLTHELAHLCGGDTASSALFGPKLAQFEQYMGMMYENPATRSVFYPLCLFRMIFELALQRDNRRREFRADCLAAKTFSAQGIVHSLIRIAAYANYRMQIERTLFEQNKKHQTALGIAGAIASGLHDYANSKEFIDTMRVGNVPHPFDSHPPLTERMRNVGYEVPENQYAAIVTQAPAQTWINGMPTAEDIERRLWTKYERGFAEAHDESLAWRYEPANAEEEEVVLRHFPTVDFSLKKGKKVQISYLGFTDSKGEHIAWDRIGKIKYQNGIGGSDVLVITRPERKLLGNKTRVKLPGVERERFKETFGKYWYRHQMMRQAQKDR